MSRRDDTGAAAVEMALVLPILVLLVFGIIEFSRAYNAQITLTHAAREGVRVLAVTRDPGQAVDATKNAAASLPADEVAVATSACNPGDPTEVTASYAFTYMIPLFGDGTLNLTGTGVMRCGG